MKATQDVQAPSTTVTEKKTAKVGGGRVARRSWLVFAITMAVIAGAAVGMFLPVPREVVGILAMVLLLGLLFLKLPIAFAMIIPSLLGMYVLRGEALVWGQLGSVPYSEVASWSLSVIPLFVLMGLLMWRSGLSANIFDAAQKVLGRVPGGLAVGTNLAGTGLAAVSGSTVGTTYALARSSIPEMLKAGYDKRIAVGAVMVAGLPGQLIPPSILLVVYAGIAETPVGPQLLAGVGPGVLVSLCFSIAIMGLAWKLSPGGRVARKVPINDQLKSLLGIWPLPVIVLVIVVGMFSGVFTATEAAAFSALVAMVITFIWKRKGGAWQAISQASIATIASVGSIFLLLVAVALLSQMFTLTGISEAFAQVVQDANFNRIGFLLVMLGVYLVLGAFMEPLSMMVLTIPILMPTLEVLDISLLWYGVFAVLMGELAVVTPPVGILSFILYQITKEPEVNQGQKIYLNDIFAAALWLLPVAVLVAVILIFFPEIATWLPDMSAA